MCAGSVVLQQVGVSSLTRDRTRVPCPAGQVHDRWAPGGPVSCLPTATPGRCEVAAPCGLTCVSLVIREAEDFSCSRCRSVWRHTCSHLQLVCNRVIRVFAFELYEFLVCTGDPSHSAGMRFVNSLAHPSVAFPFCEWSPLCWSDPTGRSLLCGQCLSGPGPPQALLDGGPGCSASLGPQSASWAGRGHRPQCRPHQDPTPEPRWWPWLSWWIVPMWRHVCPTAFWVRLRRAIHVETKQNWVLTSRLMGFPGGSSGEEPACQCRRHKRHGFNPWVRKLPWRTAWLPTPSSTLAWRIPWTEEPGGLQSIRSHRVGHD